MNPKQAVVLRTSLCTALLCVLLCLGVGADESANGLPPALAHTYEARTPAEQMTTTRHLFADFHMVDISLEVREVDDFLLTPALLVQEAVSDGVILTYPEE
ncbi:MAG TPA: hypothetical protein PK373_10020 [Sedimentisphaerales bacterium]|nr:hypothetical protein [Sedimentisphaerales bacterium]HQG49412.1 hypothetical protein [Sedimentisphaerales bacterium]